MTSRRGVNRLAQANNNIVAAAQRDLEAIMARVDQGDPAATLAALKAAVPALVERYGDAAAAAAADWYDDIRPTGLPRYSSTVGDNYPVEAVEQRVASAGVHVANGNPGRFLQVMSTSLDKFVKQSSRNTIVKNGQRDPWKPRFARVPSGSTTCGFCLMLASRGAVYLTQESAGQMTQFHGECDCQIVPIGPNDPLPDGYDPDALYQQYLEARDEVGADARAISEAMERNRDRNLNEAKVEDETPLDQLSMQGLEERMEAAMARGDWQEAERAGELLDAGFFEASGARLDTTDPFRDDTYRWFEEADEATQNRFLDGLRDAQRDMWLQAQYEAISGRTVKTVPAARDQRVLYETYLETEYLKAEAQCNGFMLTPHARAAGRSGRDLWSVNESTARSWASPEMLEYWDSNPRYTWKDWQAMNAGDTSSTQTKAGTWQG